MPRLPLSPVAFLFVCSTRVAATNQGLAMCAWLVVASALLVTDANAESVVISASKDNSIYSDNVTNSNGAGDNIFTGKTQLGFTRRGFIAFDVAGVLPAGALIDSVVLHLNMSREPAGAGPHPVSLHRVLADWGEGDSDAPLNEGQGAPATPNDVTWTYRFFDTDTWATPGGEFSPVVSATRLVNDIGPYTWRSAAMRDDVQAWLDAPAANFGWVLIGNEGISGTSKRFDSKDDVASPAHPSLTVYYRQPTAVGDGTPTLGARLLGALPNPFSQSTTLRFELSSAQPVALTVFDASGRLVRQLARGEYSMGVHGAEWDGRNDVGVNVGSGVYFLRLESNGHTADTKRVVLVR